MNRVFTCLLFLLFLLGANNISFCQTDDAHRNPGDIKIGTEKYVQRPLAPPGNDDPCSATVLTVNATCSYSTFTNVQATATAGVAAPTCGNYNSSDVWFTVTVPAGGSITFDANSGSMTDGAMAVYTGTCGSLTQIAGGL